MPQLSEMPALEILDLSKNHISSFPLISGRLINLKVLSLTNNKIYSLPEYLVDFNALKVFKVDNNPIEWPVSQSDHVPFLSR
jgi:Leucine-rich repeat (LRR) protein